MFFTKNTKKDTRATWIVSMIASLYFFIDFMQMMFGGILRNSFKEDLGIKDTDVDWIGISFGWTNVLFILLAGVLINRFPLRDITLITLFTSVCGLFGLSMATDFWVACFFRSLSGIAHAFCFLCCTSYVINWFSSKKQAFPMGVMVMIGFLGGTVAQWPLQTIVERYGWRFALRLIGTIGVVVLGLIFFFASGQPSSWLKEKKRHQKASRSLGFLKSFKKAFFNGSILPYAVYTGLMNLPIMVIAAIYGKPAFQQIHNITSAEAAWGCTTLMLGALVGSPLITNLASLGNPKKLIYIGVYSSIVLIFPILYMPLGKTTLCLLLYLLGISTSTQVLSYPYIAQLSSPETAATEMGWAATLIMGIGYGAQYLTKVLRDWHRVDSGVGDASAVDYRFALFLIVVGFVGAILMTLLMKEPKRRAIVATESSFD